MGLKYRKNEIEFAFLLSALWLVIEIYFEISSFHFVTIIWAIIFCLSFKLKKSYIYKVRVFVNIILFLILESSFILNYTLLIIIMFAIRMIADVVLVKYGKEY